MGEQKTEGAKETCNFSIFDVFDDGKYLWFTALEYNALFKMEKQTQQVDYVGRFPEENHQYRLYSSIAEYQGKLYFTPCSAHEIGVYDMKHNQFEKINIGITKQENDITQIKFAKKYISSFVQGDVLILIPACYDGLIRCDLTTYEVSMETEMVKFFSEKYHAYITSAEHKFYFCWFAKRMNDTEVVFNLHSNTNVVVFYNLDTGAYREQSVGSKDRTFELVEYDGRHIWLYDSGADTIVRWNDAEKECTEISIAAQLADFQPCGFDHSFVNMIIWKGALLLIPANANFAVKVNMRTMAVSEIEKLSTECELLEEGAAYSILCRNTENCLYLFGFRSKTLIEYEDEENLRRFQLEFSRQAKDALKQQSLTDEINRMDSPRLFSELQFSLNNFLTAISAMERKSELNCCENKLMRGCGMDIYKAVKDA